MSNKASKPTGGAPNSGAGASTTKVAKRHTEFFFDNTLVAIQVDDTLFNVHKYQLLKSETFSDMFKVPKSEDNEPEEGSSPEHPIIMEGVKSEDFVALLKVLYARTPTVFPSHFSTHHPEPDASLIIPAFRLANMWNFSDLRAFLLPLAEKDLTDIDKILFAREFGIKDWLAPAHVRLCQRQEKLNDEEAEKLGVRSLLLIARLGMQGRVKGRLTSGQYYCSNCVGFSNSPSNCNSCGTPNSPCYYNGSGTMFTGANPRPSISSGYRYCTNCVGFSYNSVSQTCYNCQQGSAAYFTYNGGGTLMAAFNQSFAYPNLEAEVKKWVDDGCMFKN